MPKKSKRGDYKGSQSSLPDDITIDVLSRLPVESIMLCRCVCKAWNSLTNDDHFVKLHLIKSNASSLQSSSHIIIEVENTRHLLNTDKRIAREIDVYPHIKDKACLKELMPFLSSHLDGLICFTTHRYLTAGLVVIYNPLITGDYLCLPEIAAQNSICSVNLGYDHSINKYKVVKISRDDTNGYFLGCEVITIGRDTSWRRIAFPNPRSTQSIKMGIFHQGSIYWVIQVTVPDKRCDILEFDLNKEKFTIISFPNSMTSPTYGDCDSVQLHSVGDHINVTLREGRTAQIWRIVKQNNGSCEVVGYRTMKLKTSYAYGVILDFIYLGNHDDLLVLQIRGGFMPARDEDGKRIRAEGVNFSLCRPDSKEKIPNLPNLLSLNVDYKVNMWCFKPSLVSIKKAMLNDHL